MIILSSFVLLIGLRLIHPQPHPFGDLSGENTDHFSHMNAARLFFRVGTDIWRQPISQLLPLVSEAQKADLPVDILPAAGPGGEVYAVPDWPLQKPIIASWSKNNPRNYPPGDLLLVAPVAIAYHFTELSFRDANRLLIILFLCYSHAALYFFVRQVLIAESRKHEQSLRILSAIAAYIYIIYFTLQGFYDAAALVPLLLCANYLQQRRGLPALLCYCVAAFLHFRAYFLGPWAIYAGWLIVSQQKPRHWHLSQYITFVVAIIFALLSLYPFFILWPSLGTLPINNPIHIKSPNFNILWLLGVGILWGGAAWCFASVRAYLDLSTLIMLTVMALTLHQAYAWHGIIPLAWLGAPHVASKVSAVRVLGARLLSLVTFVVMVLFLHPSRGWP